MAAIEKSTRSQKELYVCEPGMERQHLEYRAVYVDARDPSVVVCGPKLSRYESSMHCLCAQSQTRV